MSNHLVETASTGATKMSNHLVVGAGPVGSATASILADGGHRVTVLTRSGSGPVHPNITRVKGDAADRTAVARHAQGTDAIYNCVNPPYHRWATDWPPMAASMLAAAEACGAVLVTTANLYGYGPVDHPMTETDALAATGTKGRVRNAMWADALAAHEAGRVRVTEARASDFYGPMVLGALLGDRVAPNLLDGKRISLLGDLDAPHTVTYAPDVARTLVTLAVDERAWGRAWHVPSVPAPSVRQLVTRMAAVAGVPVPKLGTIPHWMMHGLGTFNAELRELRETYHQFAHPFVLDSSAATATFALEATPLDEGFAATIAWWRAQRAVTTAA